MKSLKYQKGVELFNKIHGGLSAEKIASDLQEVSPEIVTLIIEWIYGDLYADQAIDLRTREISNISALVATGSLPQLRNHIYAALKQGLSFEEIKHIILNVAIVAGFPRAIDAMMVLKEIRESLNHTEH